MKSFIILQIITMLSGSGQMVDVGKIFKGKAVVSKSQVVSSQPALTPAPAPVAQPAKTKPVEKKSSGQGISKEGKVIEIDLSDQKLYCWQDGAQVYNHTVSTGKKSMPTPVGTFSIHSKSLRKYSAKYGLYMPYWMEFSGRGHGIHELPEWPSGYKEGANHLGRPVSHGCVRLGVGAAKTVYNWAPTGTKVVVHK